MANKVNDGNVKTVVQINGQEHLLERVSINGDGTVTVRHSLSNLQSVEIADVDLLLTFADGSFVIIPNGAIEAIGESVPQVVFLEPEEEVNAAESAVDSASRTLADLFKMADAVNLAKGGSLRVVTQRLSGFDVVDDLSLELPAESQEAAPNRSASNNSPSQRTTANTPIVDTMSNMEEGSLGTGPGGNLPRMPSADPEEPDPVSPQPTPRPTVYQDAQEIETVADAILVIDRNITADDIINIAEMHSIIPITGRVYGDADTGDLVTLTVNETNFTGPISPVDYVDQETGLIQTILTFSIDVPGADLVADDDNNIDGSLTTVRETVFDREDYRVDITPPKPTIDLDLITEDNLINLLESGEPVAVTGRVGGDAIAGDTVTLTVDGRDYTALVDADLRFSVEIPGSALVADEDQTVEASVATVDDAAGNPSEVAVDTKTYLVDVEAPVITPGQTLSYEENQSSGAVVAAVAASDNVDVDGFRFSDTGTSESADGFFTITDNGQLVLTEAGASAAQNDFETDPNSFSYSVEAVDAAGNWSAAETITLRVTNLDEQAPVVTAGQTFIFDEEGLPGAVVATVAAEDDFGVTSFRFADTGTNLSGDGLFRIGANGQVSLVSSGGPAGGVYDLSIEAGDAAGNWSTAETVKLEVIAIKEIDTTPPEIPSGQILSYAENRVADSAIGSVAAYDAGGVTSFRFSATGSDHSQDGYFRISPSGQIFITEQGAAVGIAQNDFETGENSFDYTVQAGDAAGNWSAPETVTFNVLDINENPPSPVDQTPPVVTPGQVFSYQENRVESAVIATIAATDEFGVTGFRFVYADGVTTGTTSEDGYYQIDSNGQIRITAAGVAAGVAQNDYETGSNSFTYDIQAGDSVGNWSLTETVTLTVTDVDESAPEVMAGQSFQYAENRIAGEVVGTVAASDDTGISGFRFAATGTDLSADGYYQIAANGQISLTAAGAAVGMAQNDFETGDNRFAYAVEAGDADGNWSVAEVVTLTVTDVDESAPEVMAG
ncbi:MAG: Ig-like domain-containing protein, partial [Desulfuromonadales bacterium]|nr:Ig-like domain-containing protein [Desulfuromonadales bacterium]